jgi:FAD/FMN-containing dehydrogenase
MSGGTLAAPAGFLGVFRTDDAARAVYSEAAGITRLMPTAVAIPIDTDDLARLVAWAAHNRVPLTPRGSGSSMAAGALGPGVIVDLSRWSQIGPVDVERRRVVVGPGAICGVVDREARRVGLRFPVKPSSAAFCTIGGMAATNAAGAQSLAFGSVRRWVEAIDCVFADGTIGRVRRGEASPMGTPIARFSAATMDPGWQAVCANVRHPGVRKDSSGYGLAAFGETGEMVDLLVGSEGTLAFFTTLELSLEPVAGATSSVLASFPSLESATVAATASRAAGAVACELLDRTFLEFTSHLSSAGLPASTEAVLLAEVEGETVSGAADGADRLAEEFRRAGAQHVEVALDAEAEHSLWELRHAASPMLARLDPSLRSMQFIEDGAVPPAHLPAYVNGVRDGLATRGIRGVIFGHAGDAHVHVNPLVDVTAPGWRDRVTGLLDEISSLTGSLGGTLSGEHGDGRLRTPLLSRVWPSTALEAFAKVKSCFDPDGLLNPGVKVPVHGVDTGALDTIKYDPAAPPLPHAAAEVLREVEVGRRYDAFRLDLLASR